MVAPRPRVKLSSGLAVEAVAGSVVVSSLLGPPKYSTNAPPPANIVSILLRGCEAGTLPGGGSDGAAPATGRSLRLIAFDCADVCNRCTVTAG
jgi:hypothetical protein